MEKTLTSTLKFIKHPEYVGKYVGGYRIGKLESGYIQFNLTKKPNWFHRQIVKWCLGWYWFDV